MRVKLKELNQNPFKKEINNGKLNEAIVKKISANIKELGLMGSLPIYKRDGKYYLIAGHHRVEALKRAYGNNFEIEVTIHNFDDEKVLRGMIVENITQRSDELLEVTENLNAIRKWLKSRCSAVEQRRDNKGKFAEGDLAGSVRDVYKWLNKNGEVMSIGKISEYLKVYDNLDRSLLKNTTNLLDSSSDKGGKISIEEAKTLARIDKSEQKEMKDILEKTELDYKAKSKLVTEYLNASENMKQKILKEEIDIKDLPIENLKDNIKKKIAEEKGKVIVTHYKQYERESGNRIGKTNNEIIQTCAFLNGLNETGVLYELDWKTMLKIVEAGASGGKNYNKFMEKIIDKIK